MPLERAVAQLFAVGFAGTRPGTAFVARERERGWGVVVLDRDNVGASPGDTRALLRGLTRTGALLAAEPGTLPGTSVDQPSESTADEAQTDAQAAGKSLRAAGVRLALAPIADLAQVAGPAAQTAFSDDPAVTASLTAGAVAGYAAAGVAAAPGHFPGQGAASQDPEDGVATVGLALSDLRGGDLKPFAAVAKTAPVIQLSDATYAAWDGVTPATLLPDVLRLLRATGFEGVAMSGDLGAATAATGGTVAQAAVDALKAGDDLLYVPGDASDQEAAYAGVVAAVKARRIPMARIAQAVARVRALKQAFAGP
jgi:beta-N-acetylhexosaminidase